MPLVQPSEISQSRCSLVLLLVPSIHFRSVLSAMLHRRNSNALELGEMRHEGTKSPEHCMCTGQLVPHLEISKPGHFSQRAPQSVHISGVFDLFLPPPFRSPSA